MAEMRGRDFSYRDRYLPMGFAQLTYGDSLRDIEAWVPSLGGKIQRTRFVPLMH
jgi:Domain of unknown function (DUF4372)